MLFWMPDALIEELSRLALLHPLSWDFFCDVLMFRSLFGVLLTGTCRTRYLLTIVV